MEEERRQILQPRLLRLARHPPAADSTEQRESEIQATRRRETNLEDNQLAKTGACVSEAREPLDPFLVQFL